MYRVQTNAQTFPQSANYASGKKNGLIHASAPPTKPLAKKPVKMNGLPTAIIISTAATFLVVLGWLLGFFAPFQAVLFFTPIAEIFKLTPMPFWAAIPIILVCSLSTALSLERFGAKRTLLVAGALFFVWAVAGILAARLGNLDLIPVPAATAAALSFFAVQFSRLWRVEKQLTNGIQRLALTNHILEGKKADARVDSALQILHAVLPLEEVIIFQYDRNGDLLPVGRTRGKKADARVNERQAAWREGVQLCEEAIGTMLPAISQTGNASLVAVPLMHEERITGALFIRYQGKMEPGDTNVLAAFADQLARNFQRHEVRRLSWKNSFFDFFSVSAAEHRLEAFRIVSGLLAEQRFGSLAFSDMDDGYAIAYLDGTLAYVNRPMLRAAQVTLDRAKQVDLFGLLERFRGGVFDDPRIAIRRVLQTGEKYQHELQLTERNKTFDLQIALINEEPDVQSVHDTTVITKPVCFMVTVRDITAQKENEKLRSDMVSLMSHELRTPITSINGFAELLMLDDSVSLESREFLKIISTESQRLSRMLSTFLAVSKLEQGDKREVIKVPMRLDSVVHEVVQNIQPLAKVKRIRLVEQANSHLPPVAGDKGLITKVVTHLIDNAIKYSPERTTITISTVLEADAVRVIVEDRGYGIPADAQEKIWEKFYRVPRDGQDKEETSTGLGLAFVKEVVEQHGGAVAVESEPNQGSKFSFTLPRL